MAAKYDHIDTLREVLLFYADTTDHDKILKTCFPEMYDNNPTNTDLSLLYNYMKITSEEEYKFVKEHWYGINLKLYDRFNMRADQIGHETEAIQDIFAKFNQAKREFEK